MEFLVGRDTPSLMQWLKTKRIENMQYLALGSG